MCHPEKHVIIGVHIIDRTAHVPQVQQVLSEFGGYIKTRLGLHDISDDLCAANGLLILDMLYDPERIEQIKGKLRLIEGVEIQEMIFDH